MFPSVHIYGTSGLHYRTMEQVAFCVPPETRASGRLCDVTALSVCLQGVSDSEIE